MSLLKTAQAALDEGKAADAAPAAEVAAPVAAPAAAVAAEAVAQPRSVVAAAATAGALATNRPRYDIHVLDNLKDALPVDFNTLAQVQANQGQFRDKESTKPLGDQIVVELLSYQDSWVVSPNDTSAPKELVKYADNPTVAKDGTDMDEHLAEIRVKYHKAKKQQRLVLVGALMEASRPNAPLVGQLIQIDCSPQSRSMFLRYKANAVWQMKTAARSDESVKTVKLTAVAAKGPDNTDYTRIDFDFALPAA